MDFNPEGHSYGKVAEHRELMMLHWLCEQFAARYDHLEALVGRSKVTTWRMVTNLREAGCVESRKIMVGESMWVFPTKKGLNRCGLTYRPVAPRSMSLAHIAAINDVRLHIQHSSEETSWVSERRLVKENPGAGHLPDGVAIYEGRRVAIEVELTKKIPSIVKAKLDAIEPRFDAVVYFCAPAPYRQLKGLAETGRWPNLGVRELRGLQAGEQR